MTLQELTGQESGIVIYPEGETILANWNGYEEQCLPFLGLGNQIIPLHSPEAWEGKIIAQEVGSIHDALPQRQEGLPEGGGKLYTLCNGVKIVAPYDWN